MEQIIPSLLDELVKQLASPGGASTDLSKELDAHRRAMPLQRLIGNGMEYADALALHASAERGVSWVEAAEWLGKKNLAQARDAETKGNLKTANTLFHAASACFRFGQAALPFDTDRKKAIYRCVTASFANAMALEAGPTEKIDINYRSGKICGWLLLPPSGSASAVVITLGGFDGWREEYYSGARYLVERGLAVFLVDVPGQGETRIFHHQYTTPDIEGAFSAIVDRLLDEPRLGGRCAIWGNSFGGCLAARTAALDHRIVACCVNGGTSVPIEILDRYPRFVGKMTALTGKDETQAREIIDSLNLRSHLSRIEAPLLQLHSVPDLVFRLDIAREIYEQSSSTDKQLVVWKDGDHCIYNHSHEKHCLIADWFAARLSLHNSVGMGSRLVRA